MNWYLLIILFPILSAVLVLIGRRWQSAIVITGAVASLGIAIAIFIMANTRATVWAAIPQFPIRLLSNLLARQLSVLVAVVSTCILIYAHGYFYKKQNQNQFWTGMALFIAAMQMLIFSNDWFSFIMAWEVMGFTSWLLIATHFRKNKAAKGAIKAFLITRLTDIGLYVGAFIFILQNGSSSISAGTPTLSLWAGLAFLLAAMGKSAQVPFQSWLSAAMKGPTPVSALLHSATMVATGVILILRIFPLLSSQTLFYIGLAGGITILLTGLSAMSAGDIKKMLASSTSSHFGFMLLAIGSGYPGAAMLHLVAHAFMKSSLFMGAGIFQHAYQSTAFKDLRGGGKKLLFTLIAIALAGISLAGIPPFVGFWSKDAVLAATEKSSLEVLFFPIGILGAAFTGIYISRALRLLWLGESSEPHSITKLSWMKTGLAGLVLIVIAGGFFIEYPATALGWEVPKSQLSLFLGVGSALGGMAIGWGLKTTSYLGSLSRWASKEFKIGGGYQGLVIVPVMAGARRLTRFDEILTDNILKIGHLFLGISKAASAFDNLWQSLILFIGKLNIKLSNLLYFFDQRTLKKAITGLAAFIKTFGQSSRKLQSGMVHRELLWAVSGIALIVLCLYLIFMVNPSAI